MGPCRGRDRHTGSRLGSHSPFCIFPFAPTLLGSAWSTGRPHACIADCYGYGGVCSLRVGCACERAAADQAAQADRHHQRSVRPATAASPRAQLCRPSSGREAADGAPAAGRAARPAAYSLKAARICNQQRSASRSPQFNHELQHTMLQVRLICGLRNRGTIAVSSPFGASAQREVWRPPHV
jgi:hypothetical protein